MRFKQGFPIAGAAIACVVSACSRNKPQDALVHHPVDTNPAATVKPGNESTLLPLEKRNQWTYTVQVVTRNNGQESTPQTSDAVWTVVSSKQTQDGVEARIETA